MKRFLELLLLGALGVLLLSNVNAQSQGAASFFEHVVNIPMPQYCTVVNGVDQYWYTTNPSNLDLNGPERLANTGFETDTSNWTAANGTYATSTAQKESGSKSCLLIATAAAASITSETITNATTNKGTGEVWVYCGSAASTKSIKLVLLKSDLTPIDSTVTTVTAVTWTKLVKNKQWDGTQTGLKVRIGFNGGASGDSLYIDDVSLTQAWDVMIVGSVNTTSAVFLSTVCQLGVGFSGYGYRLTNGGLVTVLFFDSVVAQTSNSASAINNGRDRFVVITYNRTGSQLIYLDGVVSGAGGSIAAIGKISRETAFALGARGAPDRYFAGKIGEHIFVRYSALPSDIATTIARINATWKRQGFPRAYSGGTIVLDVDWKAQGIDKSTSGNSLTPAGGAITTKINF